MADRRRLMLAFVVLCASVMLLWYVAAGVAWYRHPHDLVDDLVQAEAYQRYVAGTYVTQSERPRVDVVPCDPPSDAPAFTAGWQWYCPKGAK